MTTALLVCAAPVPGSEPLVVELAAEADIVVGVDGGAVVCERAGVVPDLVVGDLDSMDAAGLREIERRAIPIEIHPSDKDLTDLDLAFQAARSRGTTRVIVTAAFAGRLDHTLASVGSLVRAADLAPCAIEPTMSAWLLHPDYRGEATLGGIGATVSAIALGGSAVVSCEGVKWPLHHATLDPLSSLGVSNVVISHAHFTVHEGCVLLVSERVGYTDQALLLG